MTQDANQSRIQLRQLTGVRLPPELLEMLNQYCGSNKLKPSRTRVIEIAIREFLSREGMPEALPQSTVPASAGPRIRRL